MYVCMYVVRFTEWILFRIWINFWIYEYI